jgi:hypothetical protein
MKYSERVFVALVIQHAKRMRSIILSSVVYLHLPYFCTFSKKWYDFRQKAIQHKMCVLIFSTTLSETFLTLSRIHQHIIINVHRFSCKVTVTLVRF